MKIIIKKETSKIRIPIIIPLGLVSFILRKYGKNIMTKHCRRIPEKMGSMDMELLAGSLSILREYKGLKIIEVRSQDGTEVTIIV